MQIMKTINSINTRNGNFIVGGDDIPWGSIIEVIAKIGEIIQK